MLGEIWRAVTANVIQLQLSPALGAIHSHQFCDCQLFFTGGCASAAAHSLSSPLQFLFRTPLLLISVAKTAYATPRRFLEPGFRSFNSAVLRSLNSPLTVVFRSTALLLARTKNVFVSGLQADAAHVPAVSDPSGPCCQFSRVHGWTNNCPPLADVQGECPHLARTGTAQMSNNFLERAAEMEDDIGGPVDQTLTRIELERICHGKTPPRDLNLEIGNDGWFAHPNPSTFPSPSHVAHQEGADPTAMPSDYPAPMGVYDGEFKAKRLDARA
jgi:hypothetical protein